MTFLSIEANCVLIGACIPTLYPLVKKVFGSSALGGSTPNENDGSGPQGKKYNIVTIGSTGKKRKIWTSTFELETTRAAESQDVILGIEQARSVHSGREGQRDERV